MNSTTTTAPFGFRRDLHRWRQLVTPAWVAGLVAGAPLVATPAHAWRLFEVGCGAAAAFELGHIPGAGYLDTCELETAPLWNKVSDHALELLLLHHGIRHDVTVVLYGRNPLAAARAAQLMLYAGVEDVRLLDGGFDAWDRAGLPLQPGTAPLFEPAAEFGAALPVHPDYLLDMPQARLLLGRADAALVSTRTWNEFIGQTSGYSYIDAKGDIAGARWGRDGDDDDVNSMTEFHQHDGRMKPAAEICRMWGAAGIHAGQHTVFYCGTGWRASLAFFYAWLMDWQRIGVYDGGWCEWSADPANPVVRRVDEGDAALRG
ncbi:MAG TPA: rhodanese-like domain-containing protein [Telluria sp.]|nr:rhodanese-like domain-containing protein [Telluria sp.]